MGIWTEFENTVVRMFRFVNGKQVVLWGYERSGWFIEHLFKRNNKQIAVSYTHLTLPTMATV